MKIKFSRIKQCPEKKKKKFIKSFEFFQLKIKFILKNSEFIFPLVYSFFSTPPIPP